MERTIKIYTENEKNFLVSACKLLEIKQDYIKQVTPLTYYDFLLTGDIEQFNLLTDLLKFNYERNIIK